MNERTNETNEKRAGIYSGNETKYKLRSMYRICIYINREKKKRDSFAVILDI